MPLPIGQIAVFAAIALPYVVLLTVLGLPFSHTIIWLYVLPPGVATWLVTRPVLESKRLPELVRSQVRYLAEPRVWCRMAPLAESDVVHVTGRVWRLSPAARARLRSEAEATESQASAEPAAARMRARRSDRPESRRPADQRPAKLPAPALTPRPARPAARGPAARGPVARGPVPRGNAGVFNRPVAQALAGLLVAPTPGANASQPLLQRPVGQPRPMRAPTAPPTRPAAHSAGLMSGPPQVPAPSAEPMSGPPQVPAPSAEPMPVLPQVPAPRPAAPPVVTQPPPVSPPVSPEIAPVVTERPGLAAAVQQQPELAPAEPQRPEPPQPEPPRPEAQRPEAPLAEPRPAEPQRPARPVVTVVGQPVAKELPPTVEHALAGPAARRGDGRTGRVTVVPGGHRPGKPDQLQRDRSRAQLPIEGKRRILVLGCTVGAGQTITALLIGDVLSSLRPEAVAVLDLNPGSDSLAQRSLSRPALSQAASLGSSRLAVLTMAASDARDDAVRPIDAVGAIDPASAATAFEQATLRHQIVLADPSTAAVPRMLALADQLVLVAPASGSAAQGIGMTFEWLDAHGQRALSDGAIMVMNGVSRRSTEFVEQAERVCRGQCRAIVRVPWDDQLASHSVRRSTPTTAATTASPQWTGLLSPATAGAYTALAGVLVAALTGPGAGRAVR